MKPRVVPELQDWSGDGFHFVSAAESADSFSWVWSADVDPVSSGVPQTETFLIPGTQSAESQSGTVDDGGALVYGENHDGDFSYHVSDATPTADEYDGTAQTVISLATAPSVLPVTGGALSAISPVAVSMPEPWNSYGGAFALPAHADYQLPVAGLASPSQGAPSVAVLASSAAPAEGCSGVTTDAGFGSGGATAAQVQQALDESGLSVNGAGIKVGVLSDSFNALGGAAADEADGALPSASNVQVLQDFLTGGSDEGRAMMQVIHDIAPGASEAFYTAEFGQQAFANGILALAAAGCKVICDDANYYDEPFFQDGVIGQAIKTVEAEGVTYITAAGNNASAGYQAAWTPISGSFDGVSLTDAESFGGSLVQTVTVNTEGSGLSIPLLLEWDQPYGGANTSALEVFVFQNGSLVGSFTNLDQEPNNPLIDLSFNASGTYQIAIEKLSGSDPGLIKEIGAGNGLPITISGANVGTVFGHALTPGVIAVGAVSVADTPAFGFSAPLSEAFSSSGAGSELLFADDGSPLASPDVFDAVAVSSVDGIATTLPGNLGDFFGTSAASASLAGVAALILSANPGLTPAQVLQIMEETAVPMGNSAVSGAGLVQVGPAIAAAMALIPPDLTEYVAVNKTTVAAGGTLTIDAYDMNIGNGVSGPSTAQIYLSTDPTITTSDTVLATLTTPETLATVSQPGYYDHQTVYGDAAGQPRARHLLHRRDRQLQQPGQREQHDQ